MHDFYSVKDIDDVSKEVKKAIDAKSKSVLPIGQGKTMVLLFFNASLRTRLSTEIAAKKLGMDVISMDMTQSWAWELEEGAIMKFNTAEHIKEAATVISSYADIIGIRAFPTLKDRALDYEDQLLKTFIQYSTVPVINLESSIRHPLQSFADLMTISEFQKQEKPKIVLSWAPHVKALPQAVSNSFLEWALAAGHHVTITHPHGMGLSEEFSKGHHIEYDQKRAIEGADFVYVKNWSSFSDYGQIAMNQEKWMIDQDKMNLTNHAHFMHCLPIRRNVVATDAVIDAPTSLIYQQAKNRLHAATHIIHKLLSHG